MPGSFRCPNCGQAYQISPQLGGKSARCRRCSTIIQVPSSNAVAPASHSPSREPPLSQGSHWISDELCQPAGPPGPLGPLPPRRMNQSDRALLGVGATLASFALASTVILFLVSGGASAILLVLVLLLTVVGAGLVAVAFRRQLWISGTVVAVAIAWPLLVLTLSTTSGPDSTAHVESPPSSPTLDARNASSKPPLDAELPPTAAANRLDLASTTSNLTNILPSASPAGNAVPVAVDHLPLWQPDPTMDSQLTPYVDLDGYQIRVPKIFGKIALPETVEGFQQYQWAMRSRRSMPSIVQLTIYIKYWRTMRVRLALDGLPTKEAVQEGLNAARGPQRQWTHLTTEIGRIDRLIFVRTGWHSDPTGSVIREYRDGVVYVAVDGNFQIVMMLDAPEELDEQYWKVAKAALLTFRKK